MLLSDTAATDRPRPAWHALRWRWRRVLRSLADTFALPVPFAAPALEAEFLCDHGRRFAPFRRAAALLALLMIVALAGWDYGHYVADPAFPLLAVLGCRFVVSVGLAALFMLTLQPSFSDDRHAHAAMFAGVGITSAGMLAICVITPDAISYNDYFMSIYLVMIYQYGFLHLRARPVLYSTLGLGAVVVALQYGCRAWTPYSLMTQEEFGRAMFFFINVAAIGVGICIKFEHTARSQFLQARELQSTNTALQQHAAQLAAEKDANQVKANALIQLKEEQRTQALRVSHENARFLASAAHDLRQPMFGLGLALEAMGQALARRDNVEAARLSELASRSARAMSTTFNGVLDLSRLEAGVVTPTLTNFDVADVLREVIADLTPYAASRGVELRCRRRTRRAAVVRSDRQMLCRILKNLVSNGIKYARSQPGRPAVVLVGAVGLHTRMRLDVVDNGMGIPPQQWQRVFEPFVQLDNPERDRDKGLGLGLSIVNAMISLLPEHRLEFTSEVGRGTHFSIDVPNGTASESVASRDEPDEDDDVAGRYVVLVEDDRIVLAAMEALFVQWGMLVDTASDLTSLRALAQELERPPDLIITDYRFPNGATAREVLDIVLPAAARGETPPPVLVVSGEAEVARKALGDTVAEILSKPVQPAILKQAIARLSAGRERISCVE
ncbi:hybrid sensor histidine kinase/response regulator [Pseudoduganella chitinolytica]|uniref:histidine kinase n=1 Tax=Pseudoduganella chitinolytica TaxID=34070 RepID=A0ABY8B7A5_9BURK|nr:hybrid sensor histidine kinase/response regulator [Pseudoduganella chitinolytica]WEF31816.1 hybrid sensor histidine kinase/response regulator [Pseudoduganella chitinolytica]